MDLSLNPPVATVRQIQAFRDHLATNVPSPNVVLADLDADIAQFIADLEDVANYATDPALVRQHYDPRCAGTGTVDKQTITGLVSDAGIYVECPNCLGQGRTATQNAVTAVVWPEGAL